MKTIENTDIDESRIIEEAARESRAVIEKAEQKIKAARKAKVPVQTDPELARHKLRAYVHEYDDAVEQCKRSKQRTTDYKMKDGTVRECRLDEVTKGFILDRADHYEKIAREYGKGCGKLLSSFPIYNEFLRHVPAFGGPMTSAKIISSVDIHRAEKASQLQ